ncbi:MAG: hypothetical protein AAB363_01490 [Planctomycetota bacterium]
MTLRLFATLTLAACLVLAGCPGTPPVGDDGTADGGGAGGDGGTPGTGGAGPGGDGATAPGVLRLKAFTNSFGAAARTAISAFQAPDDVDVNLTPTEYTIAFKRIVIKHVDEMTRTTLAEFEIFSVQSVADALIVDLVNAAAVDLLDVEDLPAGTYNKLDIEVFYLDMTIPTLYPGTTSHDIPYRMVFETMGVLQPRDFLLYLEPSWMPPDSEPAAAVTAPGWYWMEMGDADHVVAVEGAAAHPDFHVLDLFANDEFWSSEHKVLEGGVIRTPLEFDPQRGATLTISFDVTGKFNFKDYYDENVPPDGLWEIRRDGGIHPFPPDFEAIPEDIEETGGSGGAGTDGTGTGGTGSALSISGRITSPASGKSRPRAQAADETYVVVAQSTETQQVYRETTDASGDFQIDIPDSEAGNAFMVAIVGPDSKPLGPVVFEQTQDGGVTGMDLDRSASLGTISLPEDVTQTPIQPGDDADTEELVAHDVTARTDAQGVPVGVTSFGKGQEAMGEVSGEQRQRLDSDRDGMVDLIDADNDGDGIIDPLDPDSSSDFQHSRVYVSFFMNLKIGSDRAGIYYNGTPAQIEQSLQTDTSITFDLPLPSDGGPAITAVRALDTPAPAYMAGMERGTDGPMGLESHPWSATGYAFGVGGDGRFEAFVRPNALIEAGDTFWIEITFADGSTAVVWDMIDFVFTNIPRVRRHGAPGLLKDFDGQEPIRFDGSKDLVLVFDPPRDEAGGYLEGHDYTFQIFYNAAGDGRQLNPEIDAAATWPNPPPGFDRTTYWARASTLTLGPDNTYTVDLPAQIFPDTVQTTSGPQAVGSYKIDITAESSGGNAAIMLMFQKQ